MIRLLTTAPILLAALLAALVGASGCLRPLAVDESCPEHRVSADGACCPLWSDPDDRSLTGCTPRLWSEPLPVGEPGARPPVARIAGDGQIGLIWSRDVDAEAQVEVASETASHTLDIHVPGAAIDGAAYLPDLALSLDGALLATWKVQYKSGGAGIFVAERSPDGSWVDPPSQDAAFSFPPTAHEPRATFFDNGSSLVLWNQWSEPTGHFGVAVAEKTPGGDWRLPSGAEDVLSPPVFFSNSPIPAVNARGDALIVWHQSPGGALMIYASERAGYDGTFTRPGPDDFISAPGFPVDSHGNANARPALSSTGEAAVVWTQENGKGSFLVYLATRTPDGVWSKPASLEEAFSPGLGYARCPQVAFGPEGDLFVVWYQDQGGGDRVLAAHRAKDGTWTRPGHDPFVLSTPGVPGIFPTLAAGPEGHVVAAWEEKVDDRWRVSVRRWEGPALGWGALTPLSDPASGPAHQPFVAIGGPGDRVVVAWSQGDSGEERVFFSTSDVAP